MVKIGIIGYGYWGPNLLRNFFATPGCIVKTVVDLRSDRLNELKNYFPAVNLSTNINTLFKDKEVDAVVIATPVKTHFILGKKALLAGKHVLLEKPMTTSVAEAATLIELAKKMKKILMIDHTFIYKDAVKKIKKIISQNELGRLQYFDSMRTNLGLFQSDVSVLWDLAAHDVSILLNLVKEKPFSVQASGVSHTKNGIENICFITLKYKSGFVAHINVSWSSPVKIRQVLIGGNRKMIVYNDVEPSEKVRLYDTGYKIKGNKNKGKFIVDYRTGDIFIPKTATEAKEALGDMAKDFIEAISKGKKPDSDMYFGAEVVRILSLAQKSLRNGEKPVYFK